MRGSLASTQEAHSGRKSILQSGGPGRGTDRWKGPAKRPQDPKVPPQDFQGGSYLHQVFRLSIQRREGHRCPGPSNCPCASGGGGDFSPGPGVHLRPSGQLCSAPRITQPHPEPRSLTVHIHLPTLPVALKMIKKYCIFKENLFW